MLHILVKLVIKKSKYFWNCSLKYTNNPTSEVGLENFQRQRKPSVNLFEIYFLNASKYSKVFGLSKPRVWGL